MILSNLFKKSRLALVIFRDKIDFYYQTPEKDSKITLAGSVAFGSENVQYGEIFHADAVTKEIKAFLLSKNLKDCDTHVILTDQLVFKGPGLEFINNVPVTPDQLVTSKFLKGNKYTICAFNKRYLQPVIESAQEMKNKIMGYYAPAGTPGLEFVQKVMYNTSLDLNKLII